MDWTVNAQEGWRLEEREVELVASRQFHLEAAVSVMSILCNWGSPISGRFDTDFLDIWAAADEALSPRCVVVYGCEATFDGSGHSQWRDTGEFVKSKTADVSGRVSLLRFAY
jgi:hypothetical protein